jgi:glutamine synthetase
MVAGMLTLDELARRTGAGDIDTVVVLFTDLYGRFMGKRLEASFFLDSAARHGTHACDYLLTVDMEMEPVAGYRFANWERGYGDVHLVPDLDTLRLASWLERTALVICDVYHEQTHKPVPLAPRSLLRAQVERARAAGYGTLAGSELEYYLFRQSYREAAGRGYRGLEPFGWYLEDYHALQGAREESFNAAVRRHLQASGVPVESSKGEWGLGQHELNVRPADVVTMADRHVVYKQCLKEVAELQGISVTFMAKYAADQAGSSCHLHLSLWQNEQNAFAGEPGRVSARSDLGPVACSDVFAWFLAGWIAHVPDFMVFYAPTVNSYKRFRAASWAPTRLAWSHDNRTAGFRIVGRESSLRIECRIPGADCNPYLAFAASLASGLDGIARRLEPPPLFAGDAYAAADLPHVPRSLREATDLFEKSSFARDALGPEVVEHYVHFFRTEQESFDRAVTDWERRRYFERI